MNVNQIIITIIVLLIDIYIFSNTQEIQKPEYTCTCAKTSHVKKISQNIIIIIGLNLLVMIGMFLLSTNYHPVFSPLVMLASLIGAGAQIHYIYLMITYINELKKTDCKCVDQNFMNTIYYYAWTRAFLLVLGVIILIGFFVMALFYKNKSMVNPNPNLNSIPQSSVKKSVSKSLKK